MISCMGKQIQAPVYRQLVTMKTDSSSKGLGAKFGSDWLFADWEASFPELHHQHINHKEAATVVIAARRWAHLWEGKQVHVLIDNKAAMQMINKGNTANPTMMWLLRELFWLSFQ